MAFCFVSANIQLSEGFNVAVVLAVVTSFLDFYCSCLIYIEALL